MPALTATQRAIWQDPMSELKAIVRMDTATPRCYCTGQDPIQFTIDSPESYYPQPIAAPDFVSDHPMASRWWLAVSDPDREMYLERRADLTDWVKIWVDVLIVGRLTQGLGDYTELAHWRYQLTNCQHPRPWCKLFLDPAGGLRTRAGLRTVTHNDLSIAPEPDAQFRIGAADAYSSFGFPAGPRTSPPPPGGEDDYTPSSVRRPAGRLVPDNPANTLLRAADIINPATTGFTYGNQDAS